MINDAGKYEVKKLRRGAAKNARVTAATRLRRFPVTKKQRLLNEDIRRFV
jgi:hypothetical protein